MKITKSLRKNPSIQAATRAANRNRIYGGNYMPPNPYDIGPADYPNPTYLDDDIETILLDFSDGVIVTVNEDGSWEYPQGYEDWCSDNGNDWYTEESHTYITDASGMIECLDELLVDAGIQDYPAGTYKMYGLAHMVFDVSDVEYVRKDYGPDDYDIDYYDDNASVSFNKKESTLEQFKLEPITSVNSSTKITSDTSDVFDEIQEIGQEFTSENTSINATRLPAVFKMVKFEPGTVNLDYGGGKFDNVADYLTQYDVVNLVYDPFNRTAEHNQEVIQLLREHGGADTATLSNVLNVIKELEVRLNVLRNISKLLKSGGELYITVYEGNGTGVGGVTKSGYQLNRKTADYLEEIQQVFPDATRKGKLITAHNTGAVTASTDYYSDDEFDSLDRSGSDIERAVAAIAYMYGVSKQKATSMYDTLTDAEIQNAIQYYDLRGLPTSEKMKYYKPVSSASTDINDPNFSGNENDIIVGDDDESLICL